MGHACSFNGALKYGIHERMVLHALLLALALSPPLPPVPSTQDAQVYPGAAAPTHVIADGKGTATLLMGTQQGARDAAVTWLVLSPGASVPEHAHETSAEILYIHEGRLELVANGQALAAGAGDVVHIPAGVKHSARVVERFLPVRAVQVYVGPGPEQRFLKGEKLAGPHVR
jgi:quercetin dioxygenase-like cupin family protein